MAKYILTDTPRLKNAPGHKYIPDIAAPEKHAALYFDAHKDAPKGLALKVSKAGSKTWVLCYYVNGKEKRATLKRGYPSWGPNAARTEAAKLRDKVTSGTDILAEKAAQKAAHEAQKRAREAKASLTLGALLKAYWTQLEAQGKYDARAVQNSLRKNVKAAHREKWDAPADELTMPDFRDIIGTLVRAKKYREAQKVRAYLRAAYAAAIKAHSDAAAIPELRKFNIQSNPARDVAPVTKPKGANGTKQRKPLTLDELRAYWKRINALSSPTGAILRLHLLTGGQRLRQFCRLRVEDVDGLEITLRDPKGRRAEEREHVIPLLKEARAALDEISGSPWAISLDGGDTPLSAEKLGQAAKGVAQAMLDAGETEELFTGEVIRKTVETRLTQAGISPHVLAHLLSHGLGGLQERHYQFYDFGPEKEHALKALLSLLNDKPADVVSIRKARKNNPINL
jgi:hypothetical protein